ncbi:MAG: AAA family ATPase [Candidatus Kerfeldbacteria bacterium]|nr:AAA family ATPase [Candidatus Kerfeldbacteria bacterium]
MQQAKALEYLQAGRNVLLTGPAGSGKTYLLNQFISLARKAGKKVAVTASTGIAATHLGGTTIHSWSGLGIADRIDEYALDALLQKEYLHTRFTNTDILIIDEISMFDAPRLDSVDLILRAMRDTDLPFGGIQVVLSGDFFQLPPITRGRTPIQFAFQARVWEQMEELAVCYLDMVYRQTDDPLLSILQDIRSGDLTEDTVEQLHIRLEATLPDQLSPTRLYTHNIDVDAINAAELTKVPGEQQLFQMTSSGKKDAIKQLKKYCLAPEELALKIGATVMCVKNNSKAGYVNGTMGVVTGFEYAGVTIETTDGKTITVQQETWALEQDGKPLGKINQLPLRLAWAITVHKSQGMTLDTVAVDLSKSFAPGMGYVALSRVRTLAGLYLRGMNQRALQVDPRIQAQDLIFLEQSRAFEVQ